MALLRLDRRLPDRAAVVAFVDALSQRLLLQCPDAIQVATDTASSTGTHQAPTKANHGCTSAADPVSTNAVERKSIDAALAPVRKTPADRIAAWNTAWLVSVVIAAAPL